MNKPTLLLMAPINTVSGYGARSRDVAHALINSDKYDVKIWPTRWGATPQNYLNDQDDKDKLLIERCLDNPNMPAQPDIFVQITVPNEFQTIGKVNIGITAGIEGVDPTTYFKTNEIHESVHNQLQSIKEKSALLFVGHWLKGSFGEDRKNISGLIKTFFETFKDKSAANQPALILKTSSADFSPIDRQAILQKIEMIADTVVQKKKGLPRVYLLHGDLTNDEMNSLYNHPKVKAHVTFTKGEGFGRPLAEASLSEKPIISPIWSGQADFLKHAVKIEGQLTNVHSSAAWENVILEESQWFSVDYKHAASALKYVFEKKNEKALKLLGKRQASTIKKEYLMEHMEKQLMEHMDKYTKGIPVNVPLKLPKLSLPKLNKIDTKEMPKLKLPKLKKVEQ